MNKEDCTNCKCYYKCQKNSEFLEQIYHRLEWVLLWLFFIMIGSCSSNVRVDNLDTTNITLIDINKKLNILVQQQKEIINNSTIKDIKDESKASKENL